MDSVLNRIKNLSESKRLISAEQVIMETVLDLDKFLNPSLSESQIQIIQNSLLSLFSANESNFSIQCSLFIASKILKMMTLSKNPQIWDIFNTVISNTTLSTIMAVGYICRYIGHKFKSQLPRLTEHLLKQKSKLDYPVVYCLRCVFKAGSQSMSQYVSGTIDFIRHAVNQKRQATTVGCIKLLKALLKVSDNPPIQQIIDTIKYFSKDEPIPFIKNEVASLISRCAFAPLYPRLNKPKAETSEWIIGGDMRSTEHSELDRPLDILLQFPNYLKMSFPHFLNLLTPSIFIHNHSSLYKFVICHCPSFISSIVPMFPADARFTYFKEVSKQSPSSSQLHLLNELCPDDKSIHDAAGVALLLTCSDDKASRHEAINFFSTFTRSHPSIILSYLNSALTLLSRPSDSNLSLDREIIGNCSLARIILLNLPHIEDVIQGQNEELLNTFFDDVFHNKNFLSPRFYGALQLLSVLPNTFSDSELIKQSIKEATQYLRDHVNDINRNEDVKRLFKSLVTYRETHIGEDYGQNLEIIKIFLLLHQKKGSYYTYIAHNESKTSLSIAASISAIAPVSGSSENEISDITKIIIYNAMKVTPSKSLLTFLLPRPLPTGFDLLKIQTDPSFDKKKEQKYLNKILANFPQLFNCNNQKEREKIIEILLSLKNVNSVAHLLVLQLCKSNSIIPKSSLGLFLKHLETNNLTVLEIISECVSHFLKTNPQYLSDVFMFIGQKKNVASCLLISSIFTNVNIPNQDFVMSSLLLLNELMKNGALLPFSIHSLTSIFLTHSMQLTSVDIILNQFAMLFQTMNTNYTMQPVVLHLCSDFFSVLIETSSGEILSKKSPTSLIILLLRCFQLTPLSYAREAYFKCCRAIIAFAHTLQKEASISFPTFHGVSQTIQLSACSAFSDFLKFESWNELSKNSCNANNNPLDINLITTQVLTLLQKTGDARASSFLLSLATSVCNSNNDDLFNSSNFNFDSQNSTEIFDSKPENDNIKSENLDGRKLTYWVSTVQRILLGNSLFSNIEIEPNSTVKKCFLSICLMLLPHIAAQKNLTTAFLDDIISSASHSTETDRIDLQEAAFPVLQRVIELFNDRFSEDGGRILDLYTSQFSQAVKVGFELNLAVSGGFLSTYLVFITDSLNNDSENCSTVLTDYLNGIKECKQRTPAYYSLATHLCEIYRKYSNVATVIHDFLITLIPIYADVFFKAAKLWKNKNSWKELSSFRTFASSFYSELLPAFAWLESIYFEKEMIVDPEILLSFCIIELENRNNSESWLIDGAFHTLPMIIECFGSKLKTELIEIVLTVSLSSIKENDKYLTDFGNIILNTSKILNQNEEHNSLRLILLSILFQTFSYNDLFYISSALGNILKSDMVVKSLVEYIPSLSRLVIDNLLLNKKIPENEALSLISLIIHHSPSIFGYLSEIILQRTSTTPNDGLPISSEFALNVLKIGLPISNSSIPLRLISEFSIKMFKRCGMMLIGKALIEKPDIGFALLSQGTAKAAFLLAEKDTNNSNAYFRFIQLCLTSSLNVDNQDFRLAFAKSVFNLSVKVLCSHGTNLPQGHQIVSVCVQTINVVKEIVGVDELNKMFNCLNLKEKLETFRIMKLHISKALLKKRNQNLAAFSTSTRTRRNQNDDDSGWQTLEIGDSDSI